MYRFIGHSIRLHFLALLFFILSGLTPAVAAEAIGKVLLSSGEAWRQSHATAALESLQRDDTIYEGDTLITHEGSLTLRMNDQATFTLHPHTQLSLEAYSANPAQIRLQLDRGHIRTQSGDIAEQHRDRYRLNTPFAALGIRGTDYSLSLYKDQLDVFVHSGVISLSPFSDDLGCTTETLGPCNTPNSQDLHAASGFWLRMVRGEHPVRIKGIPGFLLNTDHPATVNDTGDVLLDDNGDPIVPAIRLAQLLYADANSALPDSLNTQPPAYLNPVLAYYATDNQPQRLSEAEYKDALSSTHLYTSLFQPTLNTSLLNFDLKMKQDQQVNLWFDAQNQRLFGQNGSLESILAARFWGEGSAVWDRMSLNASILANSNPDWVREIRNNEIELWRLPLSQQAVYFTPHDLPPNSQGAYRFAQSWSQPLAGQAPNQAEWRINGLIADSNGTFTLILSQGSRVHQVHGRVGESGILMGGDNQFTVRGHWSNETALLLIENKNNQQQWISGLSQRNSMDSPAAKLQQRDSQGIEWGRWSHLARLTPEAAQSLYPEANLRSNRHFTLPQPALTELPKQGHADFVLVDYEAVFINQDQFQPAEVSNGRLSVDFNQRQFSTRFDLRAPGFDKIAQVNSQGVYTANGEMTSLPGQATQLNGYLANEGNTAGLLFEHAIDAHRYFSGVTVWQQ